MLVGFGLLVDDIFVNGFELVIFFDEFYYLLREDVNMGVVVGGMYFDFGVLFDEVVVGREVFFVF